MNKTNKMSLTFLSLPQNEGFARTVVSAFCLDANPSIEEISDIKTAVSEAVTNCVVHAYNHEVGKIKLNCELKNNVLKVQIIDYGIGIFDIKKAMEPFFTTKLGDERSGMGFTVMESFMDKVEVLNNKNLGTIVCMTKRISGSQSLNNGGIVNAFARTNN